VLGRASASAHWNTDVGEPSNPASRGGLTLGWAGPGTITRRRAMLRVSHGGEGLDDAETLEGAREIVRGQSPGRYDVDEIRAEPFPSGHTSQQRGDRDQAARWGGDLRPGLGAGSVTRDSANVSAAAPTAPAGFPEQR
jgi:hypothetical protein